MQLNTFVDKRMKILYALSFRHRGIVQVWAKNETNVVLSHTSMFSTLAGLLALRGPLETQIGKGWLMPSCMPSI